MLKCYFFENVVNINLQLELFLEGYEKLKSKDASETRMFGMKFFGIIVN